LGTDISRRVYSALRLVFLLALQRGGGIALHGCALKDRGTALALVGASGAGKTTFVRHHPALGLLADDLVAITGLNEPHPMVVWGHPFSGREGMQPTVAQAPLGWFGTLEQGGITRVVPLDARQATAAALRHAFVLQGEAEPRQLALQRCAALGQRAVAKRVIWSLFPSPLLPIEHAGGPE
jgi:ABC-type cobalamin/Fe3+-siderophores transport system ATPase subunit